MRVAPKVIFLVRDADGFGCAIADALQPNPTSNLTRSEITSLEFSLDKYGIKDSKASADLVQFLNPHGSLEMSVFLLPNYEPPIAACAVYEVLASLASENFSNPPTMILPFVMKALKLNHEMMNPISSEQEVTLYGVEMGATTDFTQAMLAGIARPPPSLRIHGEPLACLLQMVRVLNLPTVLLIASSGQSQINRDADHVLEALHKVGQLLASHTGLCFSKDGLQLKQIGEKSTVAPDTWRQLYC